MKSHTIPPTEMMLELKDKSLKRVLANVLESTAKELDSYVPKQSGVIAESKNRIQYLYTALGESYLPTKEEFEFVIGTSKQKYVPRIALAIARNRSTPDRSTYYTQLAELEEVYQKMSKNPWIWNRILRVIEKGYLKPSSVRVKKDHKMEDSLSLYILPECWERLSKSVSNDKKKQLNRSKLTRNLIEKDWAESLCAPLTQRIFVEDVVLLTEDDVVSNFSSLAVNSNGVVNVRLPQKPKLWGKQLPVFRPHVEILEEYLSENDVKNPQVQFYQNIEDGHRNVFRFTKNHLERWRDTTDNGFILESFRELRRVERETERNIKRRHTPINQLGEILDEESSDDPDQLDTSVEHLSESEEDVGVLEAFSYLENSLNPTQMFRWGVVEPGSEKELLARLKDIEKSKQEARESVSSEQDDYSFAEEGFYNTNLEKETVEEESSEENSDESETKSLSGRLAQSNESSRISLKTRRYNSTPRSRSSRSYHHERGSFPSWMEYSLPYLLSRWPRSTSPSVNLWTTEVKKMLDQHGSNLGNLEKKDFQLTVGLLELVREEILENMRVGEASIKDGCSLDLRKACVKNLVKDGKSNTANRILDQSSQLLTVSKKKAFSEAVIDQSIRSALPVLDLRKMFTSGGTKKHSVVNHVTEKRSGFNAIRWIAEGAFKNPKHNRRRASTALAKEFFHLSKTNKLPFAHQQRMKLYSEIWVLMGRTGVSEELETTNSRVDNKRNKKLTKN
jgi:ribosomal protein S7